MLHFGEQEEGEKQSVLNRNKTVENGCMKED